MKNSLIIIGLLAVGLITLSIVPRTATADSPAKQPRAAIIIGYTSEYGPPVQTDNGGYRPQTGLVVTWVSCSRACPDNLIGKQLGEAIAIYMEAGFAVESGRKGEAQLEQPQLFGHYLLTR